MKVTCKKISILMLVLLLSGCSLFQKENRVSLNALDDLTADTPVAKNPWLRAGAVPVALPIGVTACVVDAVLITPAKALTPAWQDTSSFLWENPEGSDFRQMALLLPKTVATPVLFGTDWAMRSLFGFTEGKKGGAK